MKVKQKEIFPDVIFLKAPEGVDLDIVGEIIGGDNWDIIFLEDGIACKVDRVDDVLEAYQQCLIGSNIFFMKSILKQILNEINDDDAFNLQNVDWDALKEAVKDEGVNKNSDYENIKDTVIDLFGSVGYEEFGIIDNDKALN